MSRGTGQVERTALAIVQEHPNGIRPADVARHRADGRTPTPSECESVRRALDRLADVGVIDKHYSRWVGRG
jgi:hypothetical protein